ncbi:hypothetical protein FA95DRAFT_234971 [Auriscalpium vulgare]|uniref:Uncharacterized protein n=1 Tax=Auriscalpium vulgare TaxID=40419 RepID=A0ACB8S632_9AGAM|nr:hypothetical protein FA95DRAFT_234971 [Auriscalpium vulgare]
MERGSACESMPAHSDRVMYASASSMPSTALLPQPVLPLAQLESLKFKAIQLIDSLTSLQALLQYGHTAAMPPWPDILAKYAVLVSQTHVFASSLSPVAGLSLHPRVGLSEVLFDGEVIPLLRNQQTMDVLRAETLAVRRLAAHIGIDLDSQQEHARVLNACSQIRQEHDARTDRAKRAVALLREKYDWKVRVSVEELEDDWDEEHDGVQPADNMETAPSVGSGNTSEDDEEELENVLGTGAATPEPEDVRMRDS